MPWIKFARAGRWAQEQARAPQFDVSEGEVREVSHWVADLACGAKFKDGTPQAERVDAPTAEPALPEAEEDETLPPGPVEKSEKALTRKQKRGQRGGE